MSIQCQSYANLVPFSRQCIPIQCQSIPILRQSNVNPCQLTSVRTDNAGIVEGTSTIEGPTSLGTAWFDPQPFPCQSKTNPIPIFNQSTNLMSIVKQSAYPSPIIRPSRFIIRWNSNHPNWHSIGMGHVNDIPIRVTIPHIVKGTSTIRSRLLSGRHQFRTTFRCRHTSPQYANRVQIWCPSDTNPLSICCLSITNLN